MPFLLTFAMNISVDLLILLFHVLQTTKRKGWIDHGIDHPESIADHMYHMALMSLIAGDIPGVDRERLNAIL